MVGRRFGKFASAGLAAFGAGAAFVPAAHAEVPPESGINPSQSDSSDVVQSISQSAFSVINPGESRLIPGQDGVTTIVVVNDRRSAISIGDMFEMQMIINHYGGTVTTGQINSGGHVQAAVVFGDGVNM